MEQVDGLAVGRLRQRLHARDEWRNADAAAHPDLRARAPSNVNCP
jgi:hypothetical protein